MKQGRKSYWELKIEPRLEEIAGLCRDGFTNKQISQFIGVGESTFLRWKSKKEELREALKINKYIADLKVENSLYKRAIGYTITEVTEEIYGSPTGKLDKNGKAEIKADKIHRKTTKKEIVPDVMAQMYWLNNRQPEKWRQRKQTEVTGPDQGPIQVSTMDEETYRKIRKKMIEESDC